MRLFSASHYEFLRLQVSQPCHKMVVGCRFAGSELNCSQVFHPIVTDEGLCCVFNMLHPKFMYIGENPFVVKRFSTDTNVPVDWYAERGYPKDLSKDLNFFPRTTPGVGESLGLSITLDVQYDEYYCSSGNSVGFKIAIHSPNESPNVLETGVLVAPGRETKLRIRPEKIETDQHLRTVKKKYRHCLFHNEGRLKYFAHYTQRNCEMECIAEMVLQHCGCISFYMPKVYENVTICSIYKNSCVEKVRLRKDPTIESCIDKCYPSCYDLTFYVDVFTAIISHYGFEIVNQKVEDFDHIYVEKNIGVVNMYFKENSFRSHLQTEFIGISDFLSNVGGLMGLFLGFSFISIAEFFYFAIMRPCRSLLKRKNSKGIAVNSIPVSGTIKKLSKSQRNHLSDMRKYSKQHFVDCEKIGKRKIFDKFMASQRCDEDNIFEYKDDNLLSISKSLESKEHKQEDFIS
ncbi:pickpocket protein 28-like [Teleopsis dalmanni]|uniref:pickpocket protein 28-like n=1 Tax=Teleopsis dalmanni TaxID=139649 RepID=UPI0018CE579F|nr:pickpocket protein 28-like [Teleopsis dalmanni]